MRSNGIDRLIIKHEGEIEKTVLLDRPMMRIGRAQECDIHLEDSGKNISRYHSILQKNADKKEFRIKNDEGKVGTTINNKPIHDWTVLKRGDVIAIGSYRLIYTYGETGIEDQDATVVGAHPFKRENDSLGLGGTLPLESESTLRLSTRQPPKSSMDQVHLKFIAGPFKGGEQILNISEFTIGCNRTNQVWLNDQSISSVHAEFYKLANQYFVKEAARNSQIYVNNKKVRKETTLKSGQKIRIGLSTFRFIMLHEEKGSRFTKISISVGAILLVGLLLYLGLKYVHIL
ncbi:MAG: FHA domain-containing protein [Kiritimatiellae bacterium]|nr:FHA domain-containing protein [Kiritimatiellia bacterium]